MPHPVVGSVPRGEDCFGRGRLVEAFGHTEFAPIALTPCGGRSSLRPRLYTRTQPALRQEGNVYRFRRTQPVLCQERNVHRFTRRQPALRHRTEAQHHCDARYTDATSGSEGCLGKGQTFRANVELRTFASPSNLLQVFPTLRFFLTRGCPRMPSGSWKIAASLRKGFTTVRRGFATASRSACRPLHRMKKAFSEETRESHIYQGDCL
jgi:hypothetical protein